MENNSKDKNIAVVMPAYHEADHIAETIQNVLKYCPTVIVVDDGSTDATATVAKLAGADVIVHEHNQGKGQALKTGFAHALELGADLIITIDADGQHDPADIPNFLAAQSEQNADVLVGNRMEANRNMPWIRRRTNRFMSKLLSAIMHQRVPDTQNGYRMYQAKTIPHLDTQSTGFAAESEQLLQLADKGVKIGSVPVKTIYSDEESSINPVKDTIKFLEMIFRYYKTSQNHYSSAL